MSQIASSTQSGSHLRQVVVAVKQQLAAGREKLKAQHDKGSPGVQVCAGLTELLDRVVLELYEDALAGLPNSQREVVAEQTALVAHGGYGRRDVAPYSDVDLMLLHAAPSQHDATAFVRQFTQGIYDAGLQLGFSVRTSRLARGMAMKDAQIFSSLAEARRLAGSTELFNRFFTRFRRDAMKRSRSLIAGVDRERREERLKFGDTVYLLRPNIKKSRGALRDIQLVRWVGFARYGETDPESLYRAGAITSEDRSKLRDAYEFLLRLRNELHFRTGKAQDVFEKSDQLLLAEVYGYQGYEGVLPVEQFMREYFEHTSEVRYTSAHFVSNALSKQSLASIFAPLLTRKIDDQFRMGPAQIGAVRDRLDDIRGNLVQVLRLMELSNSHNKRIDQPTWQAIRDTMTKQPVAFSSEAGDRFLALLAQPARLGSMLRRLHQMRVLEKIVPAMAHARCLMQFNEYHKYTVDEHSLRAVEAAAARVNEPGPVGDAYRGIKNKRTLHLALLLHDLGKGFPEDHSEVGLQLAAETAAHLNLPEQEAETIKFLVHKHLVMPHLAFRRDIDDESVILQFVIDVGSPDVLTQLYVLSCCDLEAVGPGVLNDWKLNLLTELYHRAMRHLTGERSAAGVSEQLAGLRNDVRDLSAGGEDSAWWNEQINALPSGYLLGNTAERIFEELSQVRGLSTNDVIAWGRYLPESSAVEYTVICDTRIARGIFHRLTGALTSKGQQILSAEINTLPGEIALDRFFVNDFDFNGKPPDERLAEVAQALTSALKKPTRQPPNFRRTWQSGEAGERTFARLPTRVQIDNNTAENFTIVDIFAHDRMGLLYTITATLFELNLSVSVAKIGTYLDQVVDVFYVTDEQGSKIEDEQRIAEIRASLLDAIEPAGQS